MIFELVKLPTWRDNLWMQIHGADVFQRGGRAGRARSRSTAPWPAGTTTRSTPSGSATTRSKPIDVEIRRTFPGHIVFRSQLEPKNYDYQTVEYTATVKPAEKADLLYEVLQHQGRNAKQNNVTARSSAGQVKP